MSIFGWCVTRNHSQCKVSYKRFWFEKRGRKEVIVFADEETRCDCPCHVGKKPRKNAAAPKRRKRK